MYNNMLQIAANSDVSVLLLGESGSGKEVAARYIHANSKRANGPFVALNCGAIANGLAESILEGHSKGAFTGATEERAGVVKSASGGTLFLDEIGEMPLSTQCKLLRILQERKVMPIGRSESLPVNFRLICATNRDLRQEIAAGRFREDLYFRLNVFPVKLPPLRERADFEDIANKLWQNFDSKALSAHEIAMLANREWPGNVRQLKNVLERYALLKTYGTNLNEILDDEFSEIKITKQNLKSSEKKAKYNVSPKWDIIRKELSANNWNRSTTAKNLGVSRGCLNYQIKKHLAKT